MERQTDGDELGSFLKFGFFFKTLIFNYFHKTKKLNTETECFVVRGEHGSHTVTGFTATCASVFPSLSYGFKVPGAAVFLQNSPSHRDNILIKVLLSRSSQEISHCRWIPAKGEQINVPTEGNCSPLKLH